MSQWPSNGSQWPSGGQSSGWNGWGPAQTADPSVTERDAVRCLRCLRPQPPLPRGVRDCVYCSAPLPVRHWRADRPITAKIPKPSQPVARPYTGPPNYGQDHPRWGFPAVVWRSAAVAEPVRQDAGAVRRLPVAAVFCLLTGLAALAAAGAEVRRYGLLLRGRTEVLSATAVVASDRLVAATATVALLLAVVSIGIAIPLLVRLHALAAVRTGLTPSRRPAAVLARLVVPGWNVYGIGVVLAEIDGPLANPDSVRRPRMSRLVVAWWFSWVVDAVLVIITLARAFGRSDQAMADTVELHVAVDLAAAVVALLGVLVFRRFRRLLAGPPATGRSRWVVLGPPPTRVAVPAEGNGVDAERAVADST